MKPLHTVVDADHEAMSRRAAELIAGQIRSKPDLLMCVYCTPWELKV